MISILGYKYPIPEHTKFFENLPYKDVYVENTWILVPTKLIKLIQDFISFKKSFGCKVEMDFYSTMDISKMIKRMFKNRPLSFINDTEYLLKDGSNNIGHWENIGTIKEHGKLTLNHFMSYDEIEISAFFNISIFTPFINKGSPNNYGRTEEDCQTNGIYIGQVGPVFQKPGHMEYRFMIINSEQNTQENGYGSNNSCNKGLYLSLWANFYEVDYFLLYTEAEKDNSGRFYKLPNGDYLDILIYKKRLRICTEVFLKEANHRASKIGKHAFCHVVGLGLDIWKIANIQNILTLDVYIEVLSSFNFPFISDVYFSSFNVSQKEFVMPTSIGNIQLHIGHRDPSERLEDPEKLLVANWAWNANSYVGNEYFCGNLEDSDAAASSFIAYIANPDLHDITEVHHF